MELLGLARFQGVLALRGITLNGKPMKGVLTLERLPQLGTLSLHAVSLKPTYYQDAPLSEGAFKSRYT